MTLQTPKSLIFFRNNAVSIKTKKTSHSARYKKAPTKVEAFKQLKS